MEDSFLILTSVVALFSAIGGVITMFSGFVIEGILFFVISSLWLIIGQLELLRCKNVK